MSASVECGCLVVQNRKPNKPTYPLIYGSVVRIGAKQTDDIRIKRKMDKKTDAILTIAEDTGFVLVSNPEGTETMLNEETLTKEKYLIPGDILNIKDFSFVYSTDVLTEEDIDELKTKNATAQLAISPKEEIKTYEKSDKSTISIKGSKFQAERVSCITPSKSGCNKSPRHLTPDVPKTVNSNLQKRNRVPRRHSVTSTLRTPSKRTLRSSVILKSAMQLRKNNNTPKIDKLSSDIKPGPSLRRLSYPRIHRQESSTQIEKIGKEKVTDVEVIPETPSFKELAKLNQSCSPRTLRIAKRVIGDVDELPVSSAPKRLSLESKNRDVDGPWSTSKFVTLRKRTTNVSILSKTLSPKNVERAQSEVQKRASSIRKAILDDFSEEDDPIEEETEITDIERRKSDFQICLDKETEIENDKNILKNNSNEIPIISTQSSSLEQSDILFTPESDVFVEKEPNMEENGYISDFERRNSEFQKTLDEDIEEMQNQNEIVENSPIAQIDVLSTPESVVFIENEPNIDSNFEGKKSDFQTSLNEENEKQKEDNEISIQNSSFDQSIDHVSTLESDVFIENEPNIEENKSTSEENNSDSEQNESNSEENDQISDIERRRSDFQTSLDEAIEEMEQNYLSENETPSDCIKSTSISEIDVVSSMERDAFIEDEPNMEENRYIEENDHIVPTIHTSTVQKDRRRTDVIVRAPTLTPIESSKKRRASDSKIEPIFRRSNLFNLNYTGLKGDLSPEKSPKTSDKESIEKKELTDVSFEETKSSSSSVLYKSQDLDKSTKSYTAKYEDVTMVEDDDEISSTNDSLEISGVEKIDSSPYAPELKSSPVTPKVKSVKALFANKNKSPLNDLTNVEGVRDVLRVHTPLNDLRNVEDVKYTFGKSPANDLRNIPETKQLFISNSPKNDLTDVEGVQKLFKRQNTPTNDLTNVDGVKEALRRRTVYNNLREIPIKRLFEQRSPKNDLDDVEDVETLFKGQNSPKNDLKNDNEQLFEQQSPKNDLLDAEGDTILLNRQNSPKKDDLEDMEDVKTLSKTQNSSKNDLANDDEDLFEQQSPKNDLLDVEGDTILLNRQNSPKKDDLEDIEDVKTLSKTQNSSKNDLVNDDEDLFEQQSSKNDLLDVEDSTNLSNRQNSSKTDLTDVTGVKLFAQKSPKNDLSDVEGVRNVFKRQNSPKNDLTNVDGVKETLRRRTVYNNLNEIPIKRLFEQKSPKNDLSDVEGVRNVFKRQNSPKNDLTNVDGVKETLRRRTVYNNLSEVPQIKQLFNQKSPKNDLTNVDGVKLILEPRTPENNLTNVSSIRNLYCNEKMQDTPELNQVNLFKTPKVKQLNKSITTGIKNLFEEDDNDEIVPKGKPSEDNFDALVGRQVYRTYATKLNFESPDDPQRKVMNDSMTEALGSIKKKRKNSKSLRNSLRDGGDGSFLNSSDLFHVKVPADSVLNTPSFQHSSTPILKNPEGVHRRNLINESKHIDGLSAILTRSKSKIHEVNSGRSTRSGKKEKVKDQNTPVSKSTRTRKGKIVSEESKEITLEVNDNTKIKPSTSKTATNILYNEEGESEKTDNQEETKQNVETSLPQVRSSRRNVKTKNQQTKESLDEVKVNENTKVIKSRKGTRKALKSASNEENLENRTEEGEKSSREQTKNLDEITINESTKQNKSKKRSRSALRSVSNEVGEEKSSREQTKEIFDEPKVNKSTKENKSNKAKKSVSDEKAKEDEITTPVPKRTRRGRKYTSEEPEQEKDMDVKDDLPKTRSTRRNISKEPIASLQDTKESSESKSDENTKQKTPVSKRTRRGKNIQEEELQKVVEPNVIKSPPKTRATRRNVKKDLNLNEEENKQSSESKVGEPTKEETPVPKRTTRRNVKKESENIENETKESLQSKIDEVSEKISTPRRTRRGKNVPQKEDLPQQTKENKSTDIETNIEESLPKTGSTRRNAKKEPINSSHQTTKDPLESKDTSVQNDEKNESTSVTRRKRIETSIEEPLPKTRSTRRGKKESITNSNDKNTKDSLESKESPQEEASAQSEISEKISAPQRTTRGKKAQQKEDLPQQTNENKSMDVETNIEEALPKSRSTRRNVKKEPTTIQTKQSLEGTKEKTPVSKRTRRGKNVQELQPEDNEINVENTKESLELKDNEVQSTKEKIPASKRPRRGKNAPKLLPQNTETNVEEVKGSSELKDNESTKEKVPVSKRTRRGKNAQEEQSEDNKAQMEEALPKTRTTRRNAKKEVNNLNEAETLESNDNESKKVKTPVAKRTRKGKNAPEEELLQEDDNANMEKPVQKRRRKM